MATKETPLLPTALAWQAAGFSVIPIRADGSKAPAVKWRDRWQHERADPAQITTWLRQYTGIGLVMGAVSGNAEMLEIEGRYLTEQGAAKLGQVCEDHGLADVWQRLSDGYVELTPSGGAHFIYRVDGQVDGNRKLASRLARDDELTPDERELLATKGKRAIRVLVETRGEGGQVVIAPSGGTVHDTGRSWKAVPDRPAGHVVTLTAAERDGLLAVATLLDELPPPPPARDPIPFAKPSGPSGTGGIAPGQDYIERGSWDELLTAHGWRPLNISTPDRTYWTRPGKTNGISAVTGGGEHNLFWCFSTSVADIQTDTSYTRFGLYATLEHNGDYSAAARALRTQGYGSEPTRPVPLAAVPALIDGNTARMPQPEPAPAKVTEQPTTQPSSESLLASDDGNALALIEIFGDRIRHCPERGRWLAWDGSRWQWCPPGGGIVREYTKQIARDLPDTTKPEISHKTRSLSAAGTSAALTQAATDARVVIAVHHLDARPYELNTPNGIVDLRTGEITAHDPSQLHTRITTCAPDSGADRSAWLSFLSDTFAGHEELVGYVQRLVGYSIAGVVRDHILPFLFGPGANGKGVFLETTRAVLGDYATTAPAGFLMAKTFAGHETEIARLAGARMVVCSEINEGDRFDEAKVKQLTGGDSLTARFMRQDHFTFRPTHTLWLMGNHQPSVASGGHSFWRRLRLVPFINTVPEEKRVDDLQGILADKDGPAILHWIVQGAVQYFKGGLAEPESVTVATRLYAKEQDTVARFVGERCHVGGGDQVKVKVGTLRAAYEAWCADEGDPPVKARTFGMTLRTRFGTGDSRTMRERFYTGIALLSEAEDDADDASSNPSSNTEQWRSK